MFQTGYWKVTGLKYAQSILRTNELPSKTNNLANDTFDLREVQLDN